MSNDIQVLPKIRRLRLLAAGIAGICAMGAAAVLAAPGLTEQGGAQAAQIQQKNSQLLALRGSADLGAAIKARQVLVENLIRSNPGAIRSVMLDPATAQFLRASQPALAGAIEAEGQWSGEVVALVADDFVHRSSSTRWMLHGKDGSYVELSRVGGESLQPLQHKRITVSGVGTRNVVAAESVSQPVVWPEATAATSAPLCGTLYAQNTAVLLMNQPDSPALPAGQDTTSYWQDQFFADPGQSLNTYWKETSYNNATATGKVFGPYTFNAHYECGDENAMLASATAAAAAAGVNLGSYFRISIVFNSNSCYYGGLGTIGCVAADSAVNHAHSVAWIPTYKTGASPSYTRELSHEFGHNLGLNHANSLDFGSIPLGPIDYTATNPGAVPGITPADAPVTIPLRYSGAGANAVDPHAAAVNTEYGDPFSAMGGSDYLQAYGAHDKVLPLNWISPLLANGYLKETFTTGDFTLVPYEGSGGLRVLRVLRDPVTSSWLWMEYRQPLGTYDSLIQQSGDSTNLFGGALIRLEDQNSQDGHQFLLDFNPASAPNDFLQSTLTPGQTWVDPYSLLRLQINSASTSGLSGTVTYDKPCAALSLSSSTYTSATSTGSITVTAPASCTWQASTAASWITLTGATNGSGNGSVPFSITANGGIVQRNGYITVQRQSLRLSQAGSGILLSPLNPVFAVYPPDPCNCSAAAQVTAAATDPNGLASLDRLGLTLEGTGGDCPVLVYQNAGNFYLYMIDDSGNGIGGFLPGSSGTATNGRCTLYGATSTISTSGNTLTASFSLGFATSFIGSHLAKVYAQEPSSAYTEVRSGTFIVGNRSITVAPTYGYQGATVPIKITGNLTNFSSSSVVSFNGGGTATNVTAVSPTQINADLVIGSSATYGYLTVNTNGEQVYTAFNVFQTPPPPPPSVPANLTATPGPGNGKVTLNWTASTNVTSYQVFKSNFPGQEAGPAAVEVMAPTTTATLVVLPTGNNYYFVVRAKGPGGVSGFSNEAHAIPTGGLPAPTNLTATAGDGKVTLSWTASNGATGYQVFQSTAAGQEVAPAAAQVTAPTTSATITGLSNGTTYYFVVRAVSSNDNSVYSNEAHAVPIGAPPPPANLAITAGSGQVALSWTASSGASSYQVFKSTAAGQEVGPAAAQVNAPTTSATISGLNNGTTYYFVVRALNAAGASGFSNEVHTVPGVPLPPANLSFTAGNGQVALSWAASSGATSYQVFKSTSAGAEVGPAAAQVNAPTTSATITGLTNGTTYYFVVRALSASGASGFSNEVHAVPGVPPAPTNLSATAGSGQVTLNWTASAGATSYQVFKSTSAGQEMAPAAAEVNAPATSATITGLTGGTTYYFIVRGVNANGKGAFSNEAHAAPTGAPPAPTGLAATTGAGQVTLNWAASSGATSYQVFKSTAAGAEVGPAVAQVNAPTTSATVSGLTSGTSYYFVVRALNSAGASGFSNEVKAVPN